MNPEPLDFPTPIRLTTDADYLSLVTRKVFHAGFSPHVVDARWPAFEAAFRGFDPVPLALMEEADVDRVASVPGVVRNRQKIRSTFENARMFVAIAEAHGSFRAWLRSTAHFPYEQRADMLLACFAGMGPSTVFYFLLEAGEATPDDKPDYVK